MGTSVSPWLQHANRKIAGLLSRDALALGFQETERRVRDASRRTFQSKSVVGRGLHSSTLEPILRISRTRL